MNTTEINAVLMKIEKASKTITKLNHREISWTLTIPADVERDPDCIIGDALREAEKLVSRHKALEVLTTKLQREKNDFHHEVKWKLRAKAANAKELADTYLSDGADCSAASLLLVVKELKDLYKSIFNEDLHPGANNG